MKIAIMNGSPRRQGKTAAAVKAFQEGAAAAGHQVEVIDIGSMKFGACIGCEHCHTTGNGVCWQQDPMAEALKTLNEADLVVVASPVYYWSFSGQMQSAISRFYAHSPQNKKWVLLLCSGSPNVYDAPLSQMKDVARYLKGEIVGTLCFNETRDDAETPENLEKVRAFAKAL